ncbi:MAG: hypothetical protein Q7R95_07840, partial [bacterium]|nr:hypothetical protein [bacterium]
MKIAFFEKEYSDLELHKPRIEFRESIIKISIPFFHEWNGDNGLARNIPEILFYHKSNKGDIIEGSNQSLKTELRNIWLVEYGANKTKICPIIGNTLSHINYNELLLRICEIKKKLEQLKFVSPGLLLNIVFGFDDKLEELLLSFEKAN